jgi:hypothetical protein
MMVRILLATLLLPVLLCEHAHAQSLKKADSILSRITFVKTDIDTHYIRKLPRKWEAHTFLQVKYNSFQSSDDEGTDRVAFDPLTKTSLGFGASYLNFALDYSFALLSNNNDSARSKGFDVNSALYVGQHIFDFGFRWFSGYYVSGYDQSADEFTSLYRGDLYTGNLFMNYLYNFNYRKFSLNASFIGTQIQQKSAGSPLAGLFLVYNDVHADSGIVPSRLIDDYPNLSKLSEGNMISLGAIAGYAYTFVLPLQFYLTLSLVPGITFSFGEVKTDQYYQFGSPPTTSLKLISKNAFGYSGNRWYGYFTWITDQNLIKLNDGNTIETNHGKSKLMVGYIF